jgi:4-aminobutyrate aminotransferase / (S)-3-amino-2-methylpropionate transaminase / 5-aminovalerate transaminase
MTPAGGPSLPQERRVGEYPGPRSRELMDRHKAAVAPGVSLLMPVFTAAGGGGVLVDVDGNSFIDFGSGIAVTSVGNAAEKVAAAVAAQAAAFTHTCVMITPYEGYVAVCEQLNALTPGTHEKRSALFNSGAEAVENAVKIARAYTGRQAVVAFDHGYHGRTNLTLALTAKSMPYKHSFGPFAPEVYRMPTSYPCREPDVTGEQAAERAIRLTEAQIGAKNLAAMVVEPIQGEGGFVVPAPGFLPRLAQWCAANGVVFIADEIQTGFCRTGDWFACDFEGVVPDLVTTAKGIAGGLPLSGCTGRAEIMDAVHLGGLGGTYGGNPVACAAALAAIDTMRELDLRTAARRIGDVMLPRLRDLAARHPVVGDVRGRGAMIALELVDPASGRPDATTTKRIGADCRAAGLLVLTAGTDGNVLRFLPPLVMPEHLLLEGLDILDKAFAAT